MKRRNFIKTAGASLMALPVMVQGMSIGLLSPSELPSNLDLDTDKILVLINMAGGNDGLNTVVPLDQYANLSLHRPLLMLPEADVLNLTPETGLHPVMTAMQNMYNNGELAIIQGVGYDNTNRSHFRSSDIVHSASDADVTLTSGWLGRYFDSQIPNFPDDYPNETYTDPFALTIGNSVSPTCQGAVANFSMTIKNPFNLNALATSAEGEAPTGYYGDRLTFLRTTLNQTNAYSTVIEAAANAGSNIATYPETELANNLKIVANLISGGLQTKVYVVSQGGYDTHGSQVEASDVTTGEHAVLLSELSKAIAAFQSDLQQLGVQNRVLGMTYTEFGRRIRGNASYGCAHGDASVLFMFGANVNPGLYGHNPIITTEVGNGEGVAKQFEYRDIYQSVLENWFCGDAASIQNDVLLGTYTAVGAVNSPCSIALSSELLSFNAEGVEDYILLSWELGEQYDLKGFQLQRSENGRDFKDYAWLAATDNSQSVYHFKDKAVEANQVYYYQLKQIGTDNQTKISPIRTAMIQANTSQVLTIYPNPATKWLNLKTEQPLENAHLVISNNKGQLVYEKLAWDGMDLRLDVSDFTAGMYILRLVMGMQIVTGKFLKVSR